MNSSWSVVRVRAQRLVLAVLLVLSVGLAGCQAIRSVLYLFVPASKGPWVAAECEALSEGKIVLILVYADQAVQYQHEQLARYNTAEVVAAEMRSKLEVDVVDPAVVEQFQAANINWSDQPLSKIGQRHEADFVLYIELVEFSTAAEESGELLRGRMEGRASLHSVKEGPGQLWQSRVRAVYPPNRPEVADIGVAEQIRYQCLRLFAERLVSHFYGHREPL